MGKIEIAEVPGVSISVRTVFNSIEKAGLAKTPAKVIRTPVSCRWF